MSEVQLNHLPASTGSPRGAAVHEQLMSPRQVAALIRVSVATVWSWLRTGRLDGVRIGRLRRVPSSEVQRVLAGGLATPCDGRPGTERGIQ